MLPMLRRTRELDNVLDVFDREFGRLMRRFWSDWDDMVGAGVGVYPVDIREDDDHIYVEAELPGFTKDQVQVTLENGVLNIVAERKDTGKSGGQVHLRERRYTRVARSFTLPGTVDPQNIEAKLENGVLYLTLAKRPEVKPRRIEIK